MTPPLSLSYHAISDSWRHRLAVTQAEFARHLTLLRDRGYAGLTFADAEKRGQDGRLFVRPIPRQLWRGKPQPGNERVVAAAWPNLAGYFAPSFSPLLSF